jgi:hypothetical protein
MAFTTIPSAAAYDGQWAGLRADVDKGLPPPTGNAQLITPAEIFARTSRSLQPQPWPAFMDPHGPLVPDGQGMLPFVTSHQTFEKGNVTMQYEAINTLDGAFSAHYVQPLDAAFFIDPSSYAEMNSRQRQAGQSGVLIDKLMVVNYPQANAWIAQQYWRAMDALLATLPADIVAVREGDLSAATRTLFGLGAEPTEAEIVERLTKGTADKRKLDEHFFYFFPQLIARRVRFAGFVESTTDKISASTNYGLTTMSPEAGAVAVTLTVHGPTRARNLWGASALQTGKTLSFRVTFTQKPSNVVRGGKTLLDHRGPFGIVPYVSDEFDRNVSAGLSWEDASRVVPLKVGSTLGHDTPTPLPMTMPYLSGGVKSATDAMRERTAVARLAVIEIQVNKNVL